MARLKGSERNQIVLSNFYQICKIICRYFNTLEFILSIISLKVILLNNTKI